MAGEKRIDILLVEDNPGDIKLITDAIKENDLHPSIQCVRDGIEAMKYLHKQNPFEHVPTPSIVLLDLNLPRKDGRTVLVEIKSDPLLVTTPVIILSGSDAPQDILACYASHANCYVLKPRDLFGMNKTINKIVDFWLEEVQRAPNSNQSLYDGGDT